jgi:hypothetical protein
MQKVHNAVFKTKFRGPACTDTAVVTTFALNSILEQSVNLLIDRYLESRKLKHVIRTCRSMVERCIEVSPVAV